MSTPTCLVLDTNAYLHLRLFTEVDWPTIVGAPEVVLDMSPKSWTGPVVALTFPRRGAELHPRTGGFHGTSDTKGVHA
jgi:hypothetical protein